MLLLGFFSDDDEAEKRQRRRLHWVRSWIAHIDWRGAYHLLVREIALEGKIAYCEFFRMTKGQFHVLVDRMLAI